MIFFIRTFFPKIDMSIKNHMFYQNSCHSSPASIYNDHFSHNTDFRSTLCEKTGAQFNFNVASTPLIEIIVFLLFR